MWGLPASERQMALLRESGDLSGEVRQLRLLADWSMLLQDYVGAADAYGLLAGDLKAQARHLAGGGGGGGGGGSMVPGREGRPGSEGNPGAGAGTFPGTALDAALVHHGTALVLQGISGLAAAGGVWGEGRGGPRGEGGGGERERGGGKAHILARNPAKKAEKELAAARMALEMGEVEVRGRPGGQLVGATASMLGALTLGAGGRYHAAVAILQEAIRYEMSPTRAAVMYYGVAALHREGGRGRKSAMFLVLAGRKARDAQHHAIAKVRAHAWHT